MIHDSRTDSLGLYRITEVSFPALRWAEKPHSFQRAKSRLDIYSISRGDGTSPLEFPKYPKGVDFENTIPCTYFEKNVFAMSSLNWDIGNECPIFCPLEARHPVILHCIQSQEKLLILRATALAAAHLSSFFFPTHQLLPQALNLSRKCRNLEVQVHHLHLQSPHAPPGVSRLSAIQNPTFGLTPHSPLTLPISQKRIKKKSTYLTNSPPKKLRSSTEEIIGLQAAT